MTDTIKDMPFEVALKNLEQIVAGLESGNGSLEDSIKNYERGVQLRAHCERKLKDAESKIEKITLGADGAIQTSPLD